MTPRLLEKYHDTIAKQLKEDLKLTNSMSVPRMEKIVVSMGVGLATQDKKRMEAAAKDLAIIAGQKPLICKAKKSVSNFKVREGYEVGCKVTLRGRRMYEFLDRLISAVVPRVRDFRGLNPASFDGGGNYSMGLTEQTVFPEINIDKVEYQQGMNINLITTARNDQHGRRLLTLLGMPFRKQED